MSVIEVILLVLFVGVSLTVGIVMSVRDRSSRGSAELPLLFPVSGARDARRAAPARRPAAPVEAPEPPVAAPPTEVPQTPLTPAAAAPEETRATPVVPVVPTAAAPPEEVEAEVVAEVAETEADVAETGVEPGPAEAEVDERPRAASAPPRIERVFAPAVLQPAAAAQALEDADTIRFSPYETDLMQLLPGRLEVVRGALAGREIRFVRGYANPAAEFTLGRGSGPAQEHIQLSDPTVSRMHARMRFTDGGWRLVNLSQTNPVLVNGQELTQPGEERALADGDQIEMGELVFLYREGTA